MLKRRIRKLLWVQYKRFKPLAVIAHNARCKIIKNFANSQQEMQIKSLNFFNLFPFFFEKLGRRHSLHNFDVEVFEKFAEGGVYTNCLFKEFAWGEGLDNFFVGIYDGLYCEVVIVEPLAQMCQQFGHCEFECLLLRRVVDDNVEVNARGSFRHGGAHRADEYLLVGHEGYVFVPGFEEGFVREVLVAALKRG